MNKPSSQELGNRFHGILLNRGLVQMGTSMEIKGDAQYLQEMTETYEALMQQKLANAEALAQRMLQEAEIQAAAHRDNLIQRAEEESRDIVAKAHAEKEAIRSHATQEGYEAGYGQGYADATQAGEAQSVQLMTEAQALIQSAYYAEKMVLQKFQPDASELIRYVTRRILHREITDSPENLMHLLQQATDALYLTGKIRLVANKEVIHHLQQFSPKVQDALEHMTRFELVGDDKLGLDEIYLISTEGTFSVGVDAQLDRLMSYVEGQLPLEDPPKASLATPEARLEIAQPNSEPEPEADYVRLDELAFETDDWEDDGGENEIATAPVSEPEKPDYPNYLDNLPNLEA